MAVAVWVVLSSLAVCLATVVLWRWLSQRKAAGRNIPVAPGAHWLFGHAPLLLHMWKKGASYLDSTRLARSLGPIFLFRIPGNNIYMVTDGDMAMEVLSDNFRFSQTKAFAGPLIPVGKNMLFLMDGEVHKRHRKLMQPTFGAPQLRKVHELTVSETDTLLSDWPTDTLEGFKQLSMGVLSRLAFGSRLAEGGKVFGAVNTIFVAIGRRTTLPSPYLWRLLLDDQSAFEEAVVVTRRFVREILEKRLAERDEGKIPEKANDVIDLMLASGGFTTEEVLDEIMVLFLAGHETTSNALFFTLYHLTQHQALQQEIQEEIDSICGSNILTFDDVTKMTHLDSFVKETLRLIPPAPMVGRHGNSTTTVEGYKIPGESEVFLNIYGIHRDPTRWASPDTFDPTRWQNAEEGKGSYFPFGYGPKMCIGFRMANAEMRACLARILQLHHVHSYEGDVTPFQSLTMSCKAKVHFNLTPRNGSKATVDVPPA